jgi:hypothetical protein
MTKLFTFRPIFGDDEHSANWLVIYSASTQITSAEVWDRLTDDVSQKLRPEAIVFLFRDNEYDRALLMLNDMVSNENDWRTPLTATSIVLATFNELGTFQRSASVGGPELILTQQHFDQIQYQGIISIFRSRNCMMRPSPATHFIHPSGKHSQGFMRIANMIVSGPEVSFLSIGLLRYLDEEPEAIWIDTASIAPIAYSAVQLRNYFINNMYAPNISSFSSWEGLRSHTFPNRDDELVLISASTSGRMARELISKFDFSRSQIVTLFSMANEQARSDGLQILCELPSKSAGGEVEELLPEYDSGSCPLCDSGSKPVRFVGDLFLADEIDFKLALPMVGDAAKNLNRFMEENFGKKVVQMKALDNRSAVCEFHINIEALSKNKKFMDRLNQAATRYLPRSIGSIVSCNEEDSNNLIKSIKSHCALGNEVKELAANNLKSLEFNENSEALKSGAVAIVAGVIRSGGSLQSVSRDLREPAGNEPRVYLVGVAKHSQLNRHENLKKDLQFGRPFPHTVHFVDELVLPIWNEQSSWEDELRLLQPFIEPFSERSVDQDVFDVISNRVKAIKALSGGDLDSFVWQDSGGRSLKLRPSFAFWNFEYDPQIVSQADVLFTMASVLENMRNGIEPKLQRTQFRQSLLDPTTFGRYNDGIIQASILRTARWHEIDYSNSISASADMTRLLKRILANWNNPRGEAATEFLISMASGRLRLAPRDVSLALAALPDVTTPILRFLKTHLSMAQTKITRPVAEV